MIFGFQTLFLHLLVPLHKLHYWMLLAANNSFIHILTIVLSGMNMHLPWGRCFQLILQRRYIAPQKYHSLHLKHKESQMAIRHDPTANSHMPSEALFYPLSFPCLLPSTLPIKLRCQSQEDTGKNQKKQIKDTTNWWSNLVLWKMMKKDPDLQSFLFWLLRWMHIMTVNHY